VRRAILDAPGRAQDRVLEQRRERPGVDDEERKAQPRAELEAGGALGAQVGVLELKARPGLLAWGQIVEVRRANALVDVEQDRPLARGPELGPYPPAPPAEVRAHAARPRLRIGGRARRDGAEPPAA